MSNHYDKFQEFTAVCLLGPKLTKRVQHFIVQLMHTTLKNVELLKHFKIKEAAPTCFDLQGNHHPGAAAST